MVCFSATAYCPGGKVVGVLLSIDSTHHTYIAYLYAFEKQKDIAFCCQETLLMLRIWKNSLDLTFLLPWPFLLVAGMTWYQPQGWVGRINEVLLPQAAVFTATWEELWLRFSRVCRAGDDKKLAALNAAKHQRLRRQETSNNFVRKYSPSATSIHSLAPSAVCFILSVSIVSQVTARPWPGTANLLTFSFLVTESPFSARSFIGNHCSCFSSHKNLFHSCTAFPYFSEASPKSNTSSSVVFS